MNKKGLTISMIFQAESANYGAGYGNLGVLKKMTRGDLKEYSYISRQAIRYNIIKELEWDNTPVEAQGSANATVVQFAPTATIKDYPEIDLFGYMKTSKGLDGGALTRNAVVRLSNAIALEPYKGDTDYLTNMGLAKRKGVNNNIAESEIQMSYYAYTITIDLDRVGIDGDIQISNKEKAERVINLLNVVEYLYRDIRGRRETLAPVFIIGGVYDRKNPFFEHRLKVKENKLVQEPITEILEDETLKENTLIGLLNGIFSNDEEIKSNLKPESVHQVFKELKNQVQTYYETN